MDAVKEAAFLGKSPNIFLDVFEAIQARLPPTGFAVGEFSLADIAAVPALLRIILMLKHDIGKYPVGEGKKAFEQLSQPKFARLMKYLEDVKARPSLQKVMPDDVSGMPNMALRDRYPGHY